MLPWSNAVWCIVVSIGQGDEDIACMELAFIYSGSPEQRKYTSRWLSPAGGGAVDT